MEVFFDLKFFDGIMKDDTLKPNQILNIHEAIFFHYLFSFFNSYFLFYSFENK